MNAVNQWAGQILFSVMPDHQALQLMTLSDREVGFHYTIGVTDSVGCSAAMDRQRSLQ